MLKQLDSTRLTVSTLGILIFVPELSRNFLIAFFFLVWSYHAGIDATVRQPQERVGLEIVDLLEEDMEAVASR